jgi:hypothetical protein
MRLRVEALYPAEGAHDGVFLMHDRLLDNNSSAKQETKVDEGLPETRRSLPLSALDGSASAGTSMQLHCECLEELSAYAAAPEVVSEPNCCRRPVAWFDASVRRAQIEKAFAASDLGQRAELVLKYGIRATCTCSRVLIESVANASVTGLLVQSHLEGPAQASPSILKELVRENQRKLAAAQPQKPKPVPTRRGPYLVNVLSGLSPAADTEKS